ncbi:MAG TPA: hypothetical protein VGF45_01980, partial [Polyangia bacterium]
MDTSGGAPDMMSATGWKGFPDIEDLSTVKKSPGCGMAPGQTAGGWQRYMISITNPKPARGTGNRVYHVKLPAGYD